MSILPLGTYEILCSYVQLLLALEVRAANVVLCVTSAIFAPLRETPKPRSARNKWRGAPMPSGRGWFPAKAIRIGHVAAVIQETRASSLSSRYLQEYSGTISFIILTVPSAS